jgi:hypothetical protein
MDVWIQVKQRMGGYGQMNAKFLLVRSKFPKNTASTRQSQ